MKLSKYPRAKLAGVPLKKCWEIMSLSERLSVRASRAFSTDLLRRLVFTRTPINEGSQGRNSRKRNRRSFRGFFRKGFGTRFNTLANEQYSRIFFSILPMSLRDSGNSLLRD